MVSEKKIAANQRNALKSSGPKTAEGKAISCRNAMKHGLTAKDVVLAHESPQEYDALRLEWYAKVDPTDPAQRCLADRAVLAEWRLRRCARREAAELARRARHAAADIELAATVEAETLGRRLVTDAFSRCKNPEPLDPPELKKVEQWLKNDPAELVPQLEATPQGAEWLLKRWDELGTILREEGFWHYPERLRAIRLLGKRGQDVLEDESLAEIFLACSALHPKPWDLHDDIIQAQLHCDGKVPFYVRIDKLKENCMPTKAFARDYLLGVVGDEARRLTALKENVLLPRFAADLAAASENGGFLDSAAEVLFRRYESGFERSLHKALAELRAVRKEVSSGAGFGAEFEGESAAECVWNEPTASASVATPPVAPDRHESEPVRTDPHVAGGGMPPSRLV